MCVSLFPHPHYYWYEVGMLNVSRRSIYCPDQTRSRLLAREKPLLTNVQQVVVTENVLGVHDLIVQVMQKALYIIY